jgi:hypothetical protein
MPPLAPLVHVIGPSGGDTDRVVESLRKLNVDAASFSYDVEEDLVHSILVQLRRSDLVVAVLNEGSGRALFEIGVAVGLGKPVGLVLTQDVRIPIALAKYPYLRANVSDEGLLTAFFARLIGARENDKERPPASVGTRLTPEELDSLAGSVRTLRKAGSGAEFERIILSLLERAATVTAQSHMDSPPSDNGVDAVIWDDRLSKLFGDSILVEVKRARMDRETIAGLSRRLEFYLDDVRATLALLIYLDPSGARIDPMQMGGPHIIPLDAEDLITALRSNTLASVVLSARNALVHGRRLQCPLTSPRTR